jgi:hypothetical protein
VDIYLDLMAFLSEALPLLGVEGHAVAADCYSAAAGAGRGGLFCSRPSPAWSSSTARPGYGCWNMSRRATLRVSFPVRSLGGHDKGMRAHYEVPLRELVADRAWTVEPVVCEGELLFWIHR